MSLFDYHASRVVTAEDHPFYGLLMALMRAADSENARTLREGWPDVWDELQARYTAPGGLLADEMPEAA